MGNTRAMFRRLRVFANTFKRVDKLLQKGKVGTSALDYAQQTSWLLFLKYLDDREESREADALLSGREYAPIIKGKYRWSSWASPKDANGALDRNKALTGEDLINFVENDLFPHLAGFGEIAKSSDTVEAKIGEIFSETDNKFRKKKGYVLRDVIDELDKLSFNSQKERHELSLLYEGSINQMGNAGRNGGEYYTPRPLIRAMLKVIDPKIGETVYDGALGSAGFLCEAYTYMRKDNLTPSEFQKLKKRTFYGQEDKPLPFIIGMMNMILHGIDTPNITYANTLNQNIMDIQPSDQHDVILANPPFGGGERVEVQQNFPIRSGETAYLFMQHFMRKLKPGGRAAIVIKNTFLTNGDATTLRKELLETCNLHTILDCPSKTFQGAGVKTVILFFEKGAPTRRTWYYTLDPGRSLGKTNPLNDNDLAEFIELQAKRAESEKSWTLDAADIDPDTWDLSPKNPNAPEAEALRAPDFIIADMLARDEETRGLLEQVRGLL